MVRDRLLTLRADGSYVPRLCPSETRNRCEEEVSNEKILDRYSDEPVCSVAGGNRLSRHLDHARWHARSGHRRGYRGPDDHVPARRRCVPPLPDKRGRGARIHLGRSRQPTRCERPQTRSASRYTARGANGRTNRLQKRRGGSNIFRHCGRGRHERVGPRDYSRKVQRTAGHSTDRVRWCDRQPRNAAGHPVNLS